MVDLRVSIRDRAQLALSAFVPDLGRGPCHYERWRHGLVLGESESSPDVARYVSSYRYQFSDEPTPETARLNLARRFTGLTGAASSRLLERLAKQDDVALDDVRAFCEQNEHSSGRAAWLLIRLCAHRDAMRAAALALLTPRLDELSVQLANFEDQLLTSKWDLAAHTAKALVGKLPSGDMKGAMLEYAGVIWLCSSKSSGGIEAIKQAEALHGYAVDGVTAYLAACELLARAQDEEARTWLGSVGGRHFCHVDRATRNLLSVKADVVLTAISQPSAVGAKIAQNALLTLPYSAVWPDVALLWAALLAADIGRDEALERLDAAARQAFGTWERRVRAANAFALARFFAEERDLGRSRTWAKRGSKEFGDTDESSLYIAALKRFVVQVEGYVEWKKFEHELGDLGSSR